jgi:DNA-binding transcriptional LysR family regulator
MTFNQLKYFQTICKYHNITRASAELHISQPSLSNAIRELEDEFGVTLFTRRSRGLELTQTGQYFLEASGKLLEQAEQLSLHMKELGTANHTISLGLPAMSGSLVFADLLQALTAISPETRVLVQESGSLSNRRKVADHTLDAAIITRDKPIPSTFGHVVLRHVDICLYVSARHPLAAKGTVSLSELDGLPLALLPDDTFLSECIRHLFHDNGLTLNAVVCANQLATIQQLVANNTVVTFLLDHVLEENDDIVKIAVPDLPSTEIDLIWKSGRHLSPAVQSLIAAAKTI